MRSRRSVNERVTEVARRRLELLTAELEQLRGNLSAGEETDGRQPPAATVPDPRRPESKEALAQERARPGQPERARPGRHAHRSAGPSIRVSGWIHDRLPPTLQGRVQLGSSHLTVVALLLAAALAVTAWWVVRADGAGTLVPTAASAPGTSATVDASAMPVAGVAPAQAAVTTASAVASPSASGSPVVVVDVAGKVRRPGIATLPLGSRVVDAIQAAGGARRGVDLTDINLARLLVDGEQIVVGVPPPPGVAAPAASAPVSAAGAPGPLVNLNTATQAQLETLPGVGPVTAAAILQWRTDNGAFTAVDELLEVSGIGEATLAELAPFVTI